MILDRFQQFSKEQDLGQVTGTYVSTDVLDYGVDSGIPPFASGGGARDMGIGDKPSLKLLVQVVEAFASEAAGTLQITLQGAPDDGTGIAGSWVSWWTSPVYTIAQMVAGARLLDMDFPRPPQGVVVPRFVRLSYVIATGTTSAGTVSAWVVIDRMDQMYNSTNNAVLGGYRAGINVAN